jgi:hypothetical protein
MGEHADDAMFEAMDDDEARADWRAGRMDAGEAYERGIVNELGGEIGTESPTAGEPGDPIWFFRGFPGERKDEDESAGLFSQAVTTKFFADALQEAMWETKDGLVFRVQGMKDVHLLRVVHFMNGRLAPPSFAFVLIEVYRRELESEAFLEWVADQTWTQCPFCFDGMNVPPWYQGDAVIEGACPACQGSGAITVYELLDADDLGFDTSPVGMLRAGSEAGLRDGFGRVLRTPEEIEEDRLNALAEECRHDDWGDRDDGSDTIRWDRCGEYDP